MAIHVQSTTSFTHAILALTARTLGYPFEVTMLDSATLATAINQESSSMVHNSPDGYAATSTALYAHFEDEGTTQMYEVSESADTVGYVWVWMNAHGKVARIYYRNN